MTDEPLAGAGAAAPEPAPRRAGVPDAPATPSADAHPATVLVTGGTGFVGRALIAGLRRDGHGVIVLTRSVADARTRLRAATPSGADADAGDGSLRLITTLDEMGADTPIDALVHLAGARVIGMPWTSSRRRVLRESRLRITEALDALVRRLDEPPSVLVAASAIGYYGVPPAGRLCDESAPPMPGVFQSDLCVAIEEAAARLEALGLRVVRLRFGVVLGREDGAYPMQALAARLGFAARLGGGQQPLPWLHRDDAVGLIRWAMAQGGLRGPVNAVAPGRCDQAGFAQALAASFGRRAWLAMPGAPLRLMLGEMADLLLRGQDVVPRRALDLGYRFRHPRLDEALADLARPGDGRMSG